MFPHDQYVIKIDGSNHLTRRNRRFLRAYKPAVSYDPVCPVASHEDDLPGPDWGARGVTDHNRSGGTLSSAPGENYLQSQGGIDRDVHGTNLSSVPEENSEHPVSEGTNWPVTRDIMSKTLPSRVGGPALGSPTVPATVRRSARSTKGRSSRLQDYITGQELENLGE